MKANIVRISNSVRQSLKSAVCTNVMLWVSGGPGGRREGGTVTFISALPSEGVRLILFLFCAYCVPLLGFEKRSTAGVLSHFLLSFFFLFIDIKLDEQLVNENDFSLSISPSKNHANGLSVVITELFQNILGNCMRRDPCPPLGR